MYRVAFLCYSPLLRVADAIFPGTAKLSLALPNEDLSSFAVIGLFSLDLLVPLSTLSLQSVNRQSVSAESPEAAGG